MGIIGIKINGREYQLACDDGQEGHLRYLADEVDNRIRNLNNQMGGHCGEVMSFLLATIIMTDEAIENKREIQILSAQLQNQNIEHNINYSEEIITTTLNEIANRIEIITRQN